MGKQSRWLFLSLALLMVVSILAACAAPAPSPAPPAAKSPAVTPAASPAGEDWKKEPIKDVVVGWATEGATAQVIGSAISDIVNRHSKMRLEMTLIPGTVGAAQAMLKGDADFWYYSTPSTFDIYLGKGGVKEKVKSRTLMMADQTALAVRGVYVRADSNIKTEADLKGKRLAHSPQMGWAKTMIESMLKANGMTLDDVKLIPVTTGTEAANMLTERTVDGFCFPGGTATVELQRTIGLRMIPMNQKAFDLFVPQYPGHELGIAPKGWEGTPEDTRTALTYVGVWIREGVNDITVYTMMKTLFENIGELHQAHVKGKGFNLATAAARFEATTPFHPGVIRYFKEKGVWGAKEEQENQKLLAKEKEIYGK